MLELPGSALRLQHFSLAEGGTQTCPLFIAQRSETEISAKADIFPGRYVRSSGFSLVDVPETAGPADRSKPEAGWQPALRPPSSAQLSAYHRPLRPRPLHVAARGTCQA